MQFSLPLSTPVHDLVEISLPTFESTYVKTAILLLKAQTSLYRQPEVVLWGFLWFCFDFFLFFLRFGFVLLFVCVCGFGGGGGVLFFCFFKKIEAFTVVGEETALEKE